MYAYCGNNPIGIAYSGLVVSNSSGCAVSSLTLGCVFGSEKYLSGSCGSPLSINFPSQKWLSMGIDFTAGMIGALSVLRWTSKNPSFYEFFYSAYGISTGEMLSNLKSPMTKIASVISYGLVAYDTYTDVMRHINAGDSWKRTLASGVVTAGVGVFCVWTAAKVGAAVGTCIGSGFGSVIGLVAGAVAGAVVSVAINCAFYVEINGQSIAGNIEAGIEGGLEWIY